MARVLLLVLLLVTTQHSFAQQVEMADTMRSEGKIYVVVGILLIILIGLIGYLISIDRKVARLEKEINQKKGN